MGDISALDGILEARMKDSQEFSIGSHPRKSLIFQASSWWAARVELECAENERRRCGTRHHI